jgi:hypothetical protein
MAIVTVPQFEYPAAIHTAGPASFVGVNLDASGEEGAAIFRIPKTGNVRKIGMRFQALATPTDTDFRLETVSARVPTGTLYDTDTNGVIASGSLVDDVINLATLTADAAVTAGDLVAIVVAPSGSPNTVWTAGISIAMPPQLPYGAAKAGAGPTYSAQTTSSPIGVLEYDDGSYAAIPGFYPIQTVQIDQFNSSDTPDEIGAAFSSPVSLRVTGVWLAIDLDNAADIVLYDSDGATPLATLAIGDGGERQSTNGKSPYWATFPSKVTLAADTTYYLAVKPGASDVVVYSWNVPSAAAMDQLPGGQAWQYVSAKDPAGTGDWTAVSTRYPLIGLLVDGVSADETPTPIATGDIELRYSTTGGSAGDSEPGTAGGSLGKYVSTSVLPGGVLQNLFAHITPSSDEATVEYRCLFYANTSEEDTWDSPMVWLPSQLSGGSTLAIGLDPAGAVDSDSASAQAEEIADGVTAPDGVTFSTPTDISNALEMDSLGPGQCAALWLRRTTPAQADALASDNAVLTARGTAVAL